MLAHHNFMKVKLIKNASEIGAGTRGSKLGLDAILIAAQNKKSATFNNREIIEIPNRNDTLWGEPDSRCAKRINFLKEVYTNSINILKPIFQSEEFTKEEILPVIIGGDHSIAAGHIAALKTSYPQAKIGVIWIDAHADLHSPYTTPSGNVHGMPLGLSIAEDNKSEQTNQVDLETLQTWEELKNLGGIAPKITPQDIVYIGLRDTEKPEDAIIEKNNIKVFRVDEVRTSGAKTVVEKVVEYYQNHDMIYISFDVDSIDSSVIIGTGTPVSNGLFFQEVYDIIQGLLQSFLKQNKLAGFELVEVNPTLDKLGNQTAELSLEVLEMVVREVER